MDAVIAGDALKAALQFEMAQVGQAFAYGETDCAELLTEFFEKRR